jgi:pyruvate kinase
LNLTDKSTRNKLMLSWGVESHVVPVANSTDEMVDLVDQEIAEFNRLNPGDIRIITAGSPPGVAGTTNMLRVRHLGGAS